MENNKGITKLKIIIIFFIIFIVIYGVYVFNKKDDNLNKNIMKEENKVVYREEGLPVVDVGNIIVSDGDYDGEISNSMDDPIPTPYTNTITSNDIQVNIGIDPNNIPEGEVIPFTK